MWRCPKCGERIDDDFDVCWDCGSDRDGAVAEDFRRESDGPSVPDSVPVPATSPPATHSASLSVPSEPVVTVAAYETAAEADAARLFLEADGVPAFLADDNLVVTNWLFSNAVGGVKLQVAASDLDRAQGLLAQHRASRVRPQAISEPNSVRFLCETCGEAVEFPADRCGHVEICPSCASHVDVPDRAACEDASMSATPPDVTAPAATQRSAIPDGGESSRSWLWVEVAAVACLAYLPALLSDLFAVIEHSQRNPSFVHRELAYLVDSLEIAAPLLVIMALGRDPWRLFGLVRPNWIVDAFGGWVIWMTDVTAASFVKELLPAWTLARPVPFHAVAKPEGMLAYLLLLVACAAGAFSEELVMRGYFIPRLERLLRSTWMAVVISAVMFASYHIRYGVAGTLGVAASGLVYGVSFCVFRRLWPAWLAHTIHNFVLYL